MAIPEASSTADAHGPSWCEPMTIHSSEAPGSVAMTLCEVTTFERRVGDDAPADRSGGDQFLEPRAVRAADPHAGDRTLDRVVGNEVVVGVERHAGDDADEARGAGLIAGPIAFWKREAERQHLADRVELAVGIVLARREEPRHRLRQT